jgi:hypothetical protein
MAPETLRWSLHIYGAASDIYSGRERTAERSRERMSL